MDKKMTTPQYVFFTGAPGSRWAAAGQSIEHLDIFNKTDRAPNRVYNYNGYPFHKGMYFGRGLPMECKLDKQYIDSAWTAVDDTKSQLVKGHDWSLCLDQIKITFPQSWTVLIYRPDIVSYQWWAEAGAEKIDYPRYIEFTDKIGILGVINEQNKRILDYACRNKCTWHYFNADWIEETFGYKTEVESRGKIPADDGFFDDVLVTVVK